MKSSFRWLLPSLMVLALLLVPLLSRVDPQLETKAMNITVFVATFAVLSLGLNVVVGYTGLLDLGYVTFLATGAIVTYDLLLLTSTPTGVVLPVGDAAGTTGEQLFAFPGAYLFALLAAGLVCALLGILRGIPTLKLTGDYYAIVTLGLAEIMYLVYLNESWLTGGANGMSLGFEARPSLFGTKLYYDEPVFYYFVLGVLALTLLVLHHLNRSRIGRAWGAIRLDDVAARASGINVSRYKMLAFAVSGFFGGVGGGLYAIWASTVAAKSLDIWQSILILCAVVLGGMGSLRGVLLGAAILFPLREVLREQITVMDTVLRVPPEASNLIYGLLLIVVMRFRPQGLLPRGHGESKPMSPKAEEALRQSEPRLYVLGERRDPA